jgi:hypothetical protein
MNTIRVLCWSISVAASTFSATGQEASPQLSPSQPQSAGYVLWVLENTKQLKVELKLERDVYFAGETAELTLTVTNPTSGPLWVAEPFSVKSGDLGLSIQKGERFDIVHISSGEDVLSANFTVPGDPPYVRQVKAVQMQPGEQRERSIRTDDPMLDYHGSMLLAPRGFLPVEAGHYRFFYGYGGGARVEFDVVQPVVRRIVLPAGPKPSAADAAPPRSRPWRGSLGELEWGGKRYLVASFHEKPLYNILRVESLAPFVRLDTLEGQMPAVEYSRESDGTVTFIWQGADGTPKRSAFRPRVLTWAEKRELERKQAK